MPLGPRLPLAEERWKVAWNLQEQQKPYSSSLVATTVVIVVVAVAKLPHNAGGREMMQATAPNHNVLPNPSSSEETARRQKPALGESKLWELSGFWALCSGFTAT